MRFSIHMIPDRSDPTNSKSNRADPGGVSRVSGHQPVWLGYLFENNTVNKYHRKCIKLLCKSSYSQFSAKFLKFCGRILLTSFNSSTLKTFARRKYLGDISHTSRVIANFGSKFGAMATRVGRGRLWLTLLNSATPKTPWLVQESWTYLSYKLSYNKYNKIIKRWYCLHHIDCVSMCCWIISPSYDFCCFWCVSPSMPPLTSV